ncbi:MAG: DNA gyrase/topoisomerase IV subunit A, partial [Muribaculaceae bacterium]|nr:DNA gyrase/topoisomerase IV subunit A [Muribaculaceae bacterium]
NERYPRFEVKFGGDDSFRDNLIVDGEEFIAVKSFHAKGKRLSNYNVESVSELEPRIVEEETPTVTEIGGDDGVEEENGDINQQEVLDKLTGQTRLFEDEEDTQQ